MSQAKKAGKGRSDQLRTDGESALMASAEKSAPELVRWTLVLDSSEYPRGSRYQNIKDLDPKSHNTHGR